MSLPLSYWNLSRIAEHLLDHCRRHGLTIWAEYGTLLGALRHNGPIPWDYDGDFAMFVSDRQALLDSWRDEAYAEFELDIGYYSGDQGSGVAKLRGNEQDLVDIVFYRAEDERLVSCQTEQNIADYRAFDGYIYAADEVIPLQPSTFLGQPVHLPAHPLRILERHYGAWQEYPSERSDQYDSRWTRPPVRPLPRKCATTFAELSALVESSTVPFILHQTQFLNCDPTLYSELVAKQQKPVFGYSSSISWDWAEHDVTSIHHDWLRNKLALNIVDSPLDAKELLLSAEWQAFAKVRLTEANYHYALCWVFTNAPKLTHWHTDPPFAGGYMKLLEGEKIWWCVAPTDFAYLESRGHSVETLSKLTLVEMLQLEDSYLWGRIYVDTLRGGDLLWFPVNTLHKVLTTQHSLGFGGYL